MNTNSAIPLSPYRSFAGWRSGQRRDIRPKGCFIWKLYHLCSVNRKIIAYGDYFNDFISSLREEVAKKFYYVFSILETQERISTKFVKSIRDGLFELRIEYESNIYRVFFIFDDGQIVVLFNGFQKKTAETPSKEIAKALTIKKAYYADKQNNRL